MNKYIPILSTALILCASGYAQRLQQPLGRGPVAVNNGGTVLVTWRRLAQDPSDATYNVYVRSSEGASWTRLNSSPLSYTSLSTTSAKVAPASEVAVAMVTGGKEQPMSVPFKVQDSEFRGKFMDIRFDQSPASTTTTTCKFVWPVDLDGDGEMDYVIERQAIVAGETDRVEAYLRDGTFLWSLDIGPNLSICDGQNDQIVAYDIDCDGKGEVVVQTSEGTRFWDASTKAYGPYLFGNTNPDIDGDGIVDYTQQSKRNPPHYITVVDGMTGREKSTIEMNYPKDHLAAYTRDNKSTFMGDEYNTLNGAMCVAYLDGIHPSVVFQYCCRTASDQRHHYFMSAYQYDFAGISAANFHEAWQYAFNDQTPIPSEFHQLRVADLDGDGRDEVLNGAFAMDHTGKALHNTGLVVHGDRFRLSDIDPDRPGMECFAIQQNAPSMLGQLLYDAATGEAIHKWYLASVGDVGRGECMDVLPEHKGYEMWSTMPNMYTAKGEVAIAGTYNDNLPYPYEGIWWDGALDREYVSQPGTTGNPIDIRKYSGSKGARLYEISKASNWVIRGESACRAMFWGDIIGDWREEIILRREENGACTGIVGFSTDYADEPHRIYCLQQDPAYHLQCTCRGYYQTPNTSFYLGYDMPLPPLPPVMTADCINPSSLSDAEGKSLLLGLGSQPSVTVPTSLQLKQCYLMAPKGEDITLTGSGSVNCAGEVWKSQQGNVIVDVPFTSVGQTYISEGALTLRNTWTGPLKLMARGTLAGTSRIDGIVTFEGALNYEGGRISPGDATNPCGTLTFAQGLNIDQLTFIQMDLRNAGSGESSDLIQVEGNVKVTDSLVFVIPTSAETLAEGSYRLLACTGTMTLPMERCKVKGLVGKAYHFECDGKNLDLVLEGQRAASDLVRWTGLQGGTWDYQTPNFSLNDDAVTFVAGDKLLFDDEAANTRITAHELMPTAGLVFQNQANSYTLEGTGGPSGSGGLTKDGAGDLYLYASQSNYTGPTILKGGKVYFKTLGESGNPSPFGAASASATNMQWGDVTLISEGLNLATDHRITLLDTVTVHVPINGILAFKSAISGQGPLIKEGPGQLNLGAANTWKGGMYLRQGILAASTNTANAGASGAALTVEQGAYIMFYTTSTSNASTFDYKLQVPEGGNFTLRSGGRCTVKGTWSGAGNTLMQITYSRTDFCANMSNYTGTLAVEGSHAFRLSQALDMSQGRIDLGSCYMAHYKAQNSGEQSLTSKIGSLVGNAAAIVSSGVWNIGYDNTDATFAGTFNASATVNKYGTGMWTLTGKSAAPINVKQGNLRVSNTSADNVTTTQALSASDQGVISGNGYVSTLNLNAGGVLDVGTGTVATKKFYVTKNMTVNGGTIRLHRNSLGLDKLIVTGNLKLTDPTIELVIVRGNPWASGDSVQVFDVTGTITLGGKVNIVSDLAEGLYWDTSRLTTQGILQVAGTTALERVWVDAEGNPIYYDPSGRIVDEPIEGHVYIVKGQKQVYHRY